MLHAYIFAHSSMFDTYMYINDALYIFIFNSDLSVA